METVPGEPAEVDPGQAALAKDRVVLTWSMVASVVVGALTVTWGLIVGSDVILFDGLMTVVGIGLSGVSILASLVARSKPSTHYPYGKLAAVPIGVVVQGAALAATLLYGVSSALQTIVAGGSPTSDFGLFIYGMVAAILSVVIAFFLSHLGKGTELSIAEVVSWRAAAMMSAVVAVGGLIGVGLERMGFLVAASYVDPVLILVAVAVASPLAYNLLKTGLHELLSGAPSQDSLTTIDELITEVCVELGLDHPEIVAVKIGTEIDVDVIFDVDPQEWTVSHLYEIRRALKKPFRSFPYDLRLDVHLVEKEPNPALEG